MVYEKEVKVLNGTVTAYRYVVPETLFDTPSADNENQCYCHLDSGACPPQGIFNATPCAFNAPVLLSFPHFFMADPKIQKGVDGLKPNAKLHQSFVNLHPELGFPMSGFSRFQMNFQVKKSFAITQLKRFSDDMILPVAWFEFGLGEEHLNEKAVDLIYQSTHFVQGLELSFKYGFLLTHIMTTIFLVIVLKGKFYRKHVVGESSIAEDRLLPSRCV